MVGWWAKQRVGACIFDLKRVLERAARVDRAKILVMAHIFRLTTFREDDPKGMTFINSPSVIPPDDLMYMFERLEGIITSSRSNGKQLRRNQRNLFSQDIPQFAQDHWVTTERGVQVWMCTVAAAILPDRLGHVREIWNQIEGAGASVRDAVAHFRDLGSKFEAAFGEAPGIISHMDAEEAVKFCAFVPTFLR